MFMMIDLGKFIIREILWGLMTIRKNRIISKLNKQYNIIVYKNSELHNDIILMILGSKYDDDRIMKEVLKWNTQSE